jgi:hypothetical protein
MFKIKILFLLSIFYIFGCKYPCTKNFITPAFIGFSPSDIDSFIVRAYQPNDNYLHLVDTALVCKCGISIFTTTNDTTFVFFNSSNINYLISSGFDWQIYIPSKNRTIFISNIVNKNTDGIRGCENPIISFVQDGQLIIPHYNNSSQWYTSGYIAYIHN